MHESGMKRFILNVASCETIRPAGSMYKICIPMYIKSQLQRLDVLFLDFRNDNLLNKLLLTLNTTNMSDAPFDAFHMSSNLVLLLSVLVEMNDRAVRLLWFPCSSSSTSSTFLIQCNAAHS